MLTAMAIWLTWPETAYGEDGDDACALRQWPVVGELGRAHLRGSTLEEARRAAAESVAITSGHEEEPKVSGGKGSAFQPCPRVRP